MDTLRVFIRWCASIDAVPQNLSEKVISPSLSEEENTRDVMVDAEDAEEILGYLRKCEHESDQHVVFQLMWRAGLPRETIVVLDLNDYDPDEQSLEIVHRPEPENHSRRNSAASGSSGSSRGRVISSMRGLRIDGQTKRRITVDIR